MSRIRSYVVATVLTAAVIYARILLDPVLHNDLPYITLAIAPAVCAWIYGRGPAFVALALTTLAGGYILPQPRFTIEFTSPGEAYGLLLYLLEAGALIVIIEAMRRAQSLARLAAERTARREREILRATLGSIVDAVIATDALGRVTFINQAAAELIGLSPAEQIGRPLEVVLRLLEPVTRQPVADPAAEVLGHGRVAPANRWLVATDGRQIPIDYSAAALDDSDGSILGTVLIFRDVSERQRRDAERQAVLAAEQEARRQAEQVSRLKDDFVAMVSHELRTPLNAILGWCHILREKAADPDMFTKGIAIIERNAKSQAQLVDDLLDMSRILAGKLRLVLEVIDLREVVESAVATVSTAAAAKRMTIHLAQPPEPVIALGDPGRLEQVIWNLLSNAIKFTPAEGRIELCTTQSGELARITVRDSGRGITAELLPHVFDRFRQGDAGASREYSGLGLGLAIVKEIVSLHNGSVTAQSAGPGRGATFTLDLPLASAAHGGRDLRGGGSSRLREAGGLTGLRILAVDDDPDSLSVLQQFLELHGANVTTTVRAEDAWRRIESGHFDLLICDLGLPEIDGYAFLRQARRLAAAHGVEPPPAIALTAYAGRDEALRSLEVGYRAHITKPFDPAELLPAIRDVTHVTA